MAAAPQPIAMVNRNGLALLFQELMTVVVRIRAGRQGVSNMDAFRTGAIEMLRSADAEARRLGYSGQSVQLAIFAVVVFLDESILNSAHPAFRDWASRPLQGELFKGHVGGETFFQHVRDLLEKDDSAATADILEVYQFCLLLGYRGRYGAGREADIRIVEDRIAEKLSRIRERPEVLSPAALPRQETVARETDLFGRWLFLTVIALAGLALILWLGYLAGLRTSVSSLVATSSADRGFIERSAPAT